jgi:diadenosine tetraphosphate (Ap4A) HIT family hydrolase
VAYISELGDDEWIQLAIDLRKSEEAIHQAFCPDHINVECVGNTVPHLHFGLIPRYKDDGRWGRPIWTAWGNEREQLILADEKYVELADRILGSFEHRPVS